MVQHEIGVGGGGGGGGGGAIVVAGLVEECMARAATKPLHVATVQTISSRVPTPPLSPPSPLPPAPPSLPPPLSKLTKSFLGINFTAG
jgi:hypothetical protein